MYSNHDKIAPINPNHVPFYADKQMSLKSIAPGSPISCDWQGVNLYGKVQFIEAFPDLKVQKVTFFPGMN